MTTGVPIYLVSACTTGEEFVSAFRRYADRGSVFVPIAEPIPAGRRGRFALALAGGGVLIEGDAEVISSSKTPSVLHGRIGMTIRFADLDDASKTVLIELEKARLVAKPPAPSIAPRVVELPAGARPVPPAASVRIDASVALAECTALGDLEALEKAIAAPPKAGPKFVVPTVPPVGAPRPKTPSTPPELRPRTPSGPQPVVRANTPSIPPAMPSLSPLPKPATATKVPAGTASDTMPAIQAKDVAGGFSATMPAVQIGDLKPEPKLPLDVALANAAAEIEAPKTALMDVPPAPMTPRSLTAVAPPKSAAIDVPKTTQHGVPPPPMTASQLAAEGPKTSVMDVPPAPMTPRSLAAVEAPKTTPGPSIVAVPKATQPGVAPSIAPVEAPTTTQPGVAPSIVEVPTTTQPGVVAPPTLAPEGPATTVMDVPPAPMTPRELAAVEAPKTTQMEVPLAAQLAATMTPTQMAAVPPPPSSTAIMQTVAPTREEPSPTSPTTVFAAAAAPRPATPKRPTTPEWMLQTVRGTAPPPTPVPSPAITPAPPIVATPVSTRHLVDADVDEPTDLTAMPIIPDEDIGRRSTVVTPRAGSPAAIITDSPPFDPDDLDDAPREIDDLDTSVTEQPDEVVSMRPMIKPPTVEEPTPSGDWTITPGDAPSIAPRKPEDAGLSPVAQVTDAIEPPKVRITGNWTIQLDSSSPDGWTEPSKVDIAPITDDDIKAAPKPKKKERTKPTPETPPELRPVARSIMMEALAAPAPEKVTPSEEPKVQIDPTLMDGPIVDAGLGASASMAAVTPSATLSALMPAQSAQISAQMAAQMPVEHMRLATPVPGSMSPMVPFDRPTPSPLADPRVTPLPGSMTAPPFPMTPAELVAMPTPVPGRLVTDGGVGFFRDSGEIANMTQSGSYPVGDSTSLIEARRRRRLLVIGISAGVAVAVGIVLVIMLAGGKKPSDDNTTIPPPADASTGPGSSKIVVTPPDAAEVEPPPPPKDSAVEPTTAKCSIEVTTVPAAAEVLLQGGKDVLGTTPATLTLPCGEEAKLLVRKLKFANVSIARMPTEAGAKVRIVLQKLIFSVKVSSSPPGATISVNGKSVAATPTTMKLPAFEVSTVTFSKDGYNVETFKVTPKQNNQTVHAQLKKKPKPR